MADTGLAMDWALERECPLHLPGPTPEPGRTILRLQHLRNYCEAARSRHVFEDTVFAGSTTASDERDQPVWLPCSGYSAAKVFALYGGEEMARKSCRDCPANIARTDYVDALAGCWGCVWLEPEDEELEKALRRALKTRGLRDEFAKTFRETRPLWYGLWMDLPLTSTQCRLLRVLFSSSELENLARDRQKRFGTWRDSEIGGIDILKSLQEFVRALDVSLKHGLPLHVRMPTPGHTDFGISTTFAHCPRCKAESHLSRWWGTRSSKSVRCRVCGERYTAVETACKDDVKWPLNPGLGDREFHLQSPDDADLIRRYLRERGRSDASIDAVFEKARQEQERVAQLPPYTGKRSLSDWLWILGVLALMLLLWVGAIAWAVWAVRRFIKEW